MNWKDAVDLAVYVNLDKRPDRRGLIEKQLDREGIIAHRISGVDPSLGLPNEIPEIIMHQKPLDFGQKDKLAPYLGGTTAFGMALTLAKMSGAKTLLHIEDDAVIPEGTKEIVLRELAEAPDHWDVLNFGSIPIRPPFIIPYNERWASCHSQMMTHFILINHTAYDTLLAMCSMRPARGSTDSVINLCQGLRYYMTIHTYFPQLADVSDTEREYRQGSFRSNTGETDGIRPDRYSDKWTTPFAEKIKRKMG